MADQALYDVLRAWDANGYAAPGATATFYATGTLTLIDVHADSAGTVLATNPVPADGNGIFPQRFLSEPARCIVRDADGVTLYEIDPVPMVKSSFGAASEVSFSPTANIPAGTAQAAIELVDTNARARDAALGDLAALDTITTAQIAPATLVLESEGIASNDNDTTIPTSAAVNDHVAKSTVSGTPQVVTGSRALATTYQNTTGKPIQICISIAGSGGAGSADLLLGSTAGGIVTMATVSSSGAAVASAFPAFIVPAGWHYRVNQTSGAVGITIWTEVR